MPATKVYFYSDEKGQSPVLSWLEELNRSDARAADACFARLRLLAAMGHELRRPYADMLRDGIYELRAKRGRVNYRMLYFFHGKNIAVVAHGITKEREVPTVDIERAIERKAQYEQDPEKHRASYNL